ncbi:MAG TPA: SCO1664 family protein [Candidatus Angelobacter sp.]|nr:SCO1664 family protein [Candidatus Angelobacter sp.]
MVVPDVLLEVLRRGSLTVEGRLVDASNATLLAVAELDGVEVACVYKPTAGERPLWDFPDSTLGLREVAAYEVSAALGWNLVPPTVWRDDGPFGQGMAQAWVTPPDGGDMVPGGGLVDVVPRGRTPEGWLEVLDAHGQGGDPVTLVHADDADLRRMCVFDSVVNNADRKGGHVLHGRVLADAEPATYGVDHGVTFSEHEKLRTVLWGWAGRPVDDATLADLERLSDDLGGELGDTLSTLLTRRELARTRQRVSRRIREAAYPLPGDGWPSLPWPAF